MALGGWISGEIYDLTGSYQAAFLNGIAFNLLNMSIAFWLLFRPKPLQRGSGVHRPIAADPRAIMMSWRRVVAQK